MLGAPWLSDMSDRHLLRWALLYGVAVTLLVGVVAGLQPDRPRLTEVYTPHFADVPSAPGAAEAVRFLVAELGSDRGRRFLDAIIPVEAGLILLALVIAVLVAAERERRWSPRHLDMLLLLLPGLLLFHSIGFFSVLQHPAYHLLLDWVFQTVFFANLTLLLRAVWRAGRPLATAWRPLLQPRSLAAIAVALLTLDIAIALVRPPDDAGYFMNLGAQRLRERGRLPYGDPLLDTSAGAAYGPLAYVAHVPFQWIFDPWVPNASSPDVPALGGESSYLLPSAIATKACVIAFHLVGVVALWLAARRMAGERPAWATVALYCGSLAVVGVGGEVETVTGISFASHILPTAAVLAAFALLPRPFWAGAALAAGAGLGFYPAFMLPAWLGYLWHDRRGLVRLTAGYVLVGLAILGLVLLLSRPSAGRTLIGTFLYDTFGHHSDPLTYGRSPFGFWGQKGPVRTWLMQPLAGDSGFTSPAFLSFLAFVAGTFFTTKRRSPAALALASGAVAVASSLVKIHATGTYLAWSYPLLLLGHFAWPAGEDERSE